MGKVTLNHTGVADLLDSKEVGDYVLSLARARAPQDLKVRAYHSRILRGGGRRAVADIVDDSPGAVSREARTGRLARLISGVG